ncbi:hypothetical protein GCM10011505_46040 [Tistrella bauzanensis]|uniref:Uncharacterized protein n=1 Tax=Tistrella bauzanensis TaxID=657419 RepID=A0ABQ1J5F1_9PROT|nr:hypothetical protein GCM10011505_46040 [Tistrella bauzanensis]
MAQQPAGGAGILAQHQIGRRQHLQRPRGHVAQIADRRCDRVESGIKRPCRLCPTVAMQGVLSRQGAAVTLVAVGGCRVCRLRIIVVGRRPTGRVWRNRSRRAGPGRVGPCRNDI